MKRLLIMIGLGWAALAGQAQSLLPPAWGDVAQGVTQSSRTVAYLPPTRVLWHESVNGASIEGIDNLLKLEMGRRSWCRDVCAESRREKREEHRSCSILDVNCKEASSW